jgi:hypothetical protein
MGDSFGSKSDAEVIGTGLGSALARHDQPSAVAKRFELSPG